MNESPTGNTCSILNPPRIVRIHFDGRVELNEGVSVGEGAKAFWDAVLELNPVTNATQSERKRARILLNSKNVWMDRALKAEKALAGEHSRLSVSAELDERARCANIAKEETAGMGAERPMCANCSDVAAERLGHAIENKIRSGEARLYGPARNPQ